MIDNSLSFFTFYFSFLLSSCIFVALHLYRQLESKLVPVPSDPRLPTLRILHFFEQEQDWMVDTNAVLQLCKERHSGTRRWKTKGQGSLQYVPGDQISINNVFGRQAALAGWGCSLLLSHLTFQCNGWRPILQPRRIRWRTRKGKVVEIRSRIRRDSWRIDLSNQRRKAYLTARTRFYTLECLL